MFIPQVLAHNLKWHMRKNKVQELNKSWRKQGKSWGKLGKKLAEAPKCLRADGVLSSVAKLV